MDWEWSMSKGIANGVEKVCGSCRDSKGEHFRQIEWVRLWHKTPGGGPDKILTNFVIQGALSTNKYIAAGGSTECYLSNSSRFNLSQILSFGISSGAAPFSTLSPIHSDFDHIHSIPNIFPFIVLSVLFICYPFPAIRHIFTLRICS